MPFTPVEDVDTTSRRRLTPHRRLQVWEKTGGLCALCGRKINGACERWIAEHIRALELGGADDYGNMGPAHEACVYAKTQDDHRRTAKAKRQKIQHIGAKTSRRPLPFGRTSPWKRKVSGQVVPR